MKIRYTISLLTLCFSVVISIAQSRDSETKIEKAYKYVPELIIKDSLFLQGIDSLIFNSLCPDIKRGEHKTFNIYSQKKENNFNLAFIMIPEFQYNDQRILKGYFEFKNYLFIWYGPFPEYLGAVSSNKKKLSYMKGVPQIISDLAEFAFDYTYGKLILTGICCF